MPVCHRLLVTTALLRAATFGRLVAELFVGALLRLVRSKWAGMPPFKLFELTSLNVKVLNDAACSWVNSAEVCGAAQGGGAAWWSSSCIWPLAGKAPASPAFTIAPDLPVAVTEQRTTMLGHSPVSIHFDENRLQCRRFLTWAWRWDLMTHLSEACDTSNYQAGKKKKNE